MNQTVLIPTVAEAASDGRLLEACLAGLRRNTVELALNKNVTPMLYPLLESHLYKQAYTVLEQLRYLNRQGIKFTLSEQVELHCPVLNGSIDGQSVQLGLALALLLSSFQAKHILIATGCLESVGDEVLVTPVANLPEKMALLIEEKNKGKWPDKKCRFFIPLYYKELSGRDSQGNPLYQERPYTELQDSINQLMDAGIEVIAIKKLSDIFNYLTPIKSHRFPSKLVVRAMLLTLLVGAALHFLNRNSELPLPPVVLSESDYLRQLQNQLAQLVSVNTDTGGSINNNQILQLQIDELKKRQNEIDNSYREELLLLTIRIQDLQADPVISDKAGREKIQQALAIGDRNKASLELEAIYQTSGSSIAQAAAVKYQQGLLAYDQLNYQQASTYFQRALQLMPSNVLYTNALAKVALELADYQQVIQLLTPFAETGKPGTEVRRTTRNNLALAWDGKGEYDKAITIFNQIITEDSQTFGTKHPHLATDYSHLGESWRGKGNYDKAIAFFKTALSIGPADKVLSTVYNNLAAAYDDKSDYGNALAYYGKALAIDQQAYGERHPFVARDYNNLGVAKCNNGDCSTGLALFDKALSINRIIYGNQHSSVARTYNNLGEAFKNQGNYDKAIAYFNQALAIDLAKPSTNKADIALTYSNLGSAWVSLGNVALASDAYQQSLNILLPVFGKEHPLVKQNLANVNALQQFQQTERLKTGLPGLF